MEHFGKNGETWAREVQNCWSPCILSLDGGGVRSYSSLLILEALMHEVWLWEVHLGKKDAEQSVRSRAQDNYQPSAERERSTLGASRPNYVEEELLPCHYFDFMYGTSTGGLIATLLGRLRMTVPEAMKCYREISDVSFGRKRSILPLTAKYNHEPLEKAIQEVVRSRCKIHHECSGEDDLYSLEPPGDLASHMKSFDVHSPRICQSCCLTAPEDDESAQAYLLRSYRLRYSAGCPNWITRHNEGDTTLKIWQVIRATCATPSYFRALQVYINGRLKTFKDGGIKENNPSGAALGEFQALYDGREEHPALLLSIGTGRPDSLCDKVASKTLGPFDYLPFVGKAFEKEVSNEGMVVDYKEGERQHMELQEHARGEDSWYKRLNVSRGLTEIPIDDWVQGAWNGQRCVPGGKSLKRIEEVTQAYLERGFDADVDSFAPPTSKLSQTAQMLVRHRRARESEGDERWKTFVGESLHKEKIKRDFSAKLVDDPHWIGGAGHPDDVLQFPSFSETHVTAPSHVVHHYDSLSWTPTSCQSSTSPNPTGAEVSKDDFYLDRDNQSSEEVLSLLSPSTNVSNLDSLAQDITVENNTDVEDQLLRSILEPTRTALLVETTCHDCLTPLLNQLHCSQSSQSGNIWQLSLVHTEISLGSIGEVLMAIVHVLNRLRDEDICDRNINIFIEDMYSDQILRTVSVPCSDIMMVCSQVQTAKGNADTGVHVDHLEILTETLLRLCQIETEAVSGMDLSLLNQLSTLCLVLSISIISYVGSHCWELDARLVPSHVDQITIDTARFADGNPLALRRRELGCLATFIGAPLWTFGGSVASHMRSYCKVSLTLAQFADLWGPLWAVPAQAQPGWLLAVHTEGGILYQASTTASQGASSYTDIECHWTQTAFTRRPPVNSPDSRGNCFAILESEALGELVPFDETAQLLVGASLQAQDAQYKKLESSHVVLDCETRSSVLVHQDSIEGLGQRPSFTVNPSCGLHLQNFLRDNSYRIRMSGTAPAKYLPESYQASFTAGKYIGVGGAKTFKRRPASTMKQRIIEYCSKPFASLDPILDLCIGLEVSACSSNAQRIPLWHALMMAYGKDPAKPKICNHAMYDPACARDCWGLRVPAEALDSGDRINMHHASPKDGWTKESRELISGLIGELSLTGLFDNDEFHCLVPPCRVLARSTNPEWTALLKDTDKSACFAILTERCLVFDGRDSSNESRKARKCCTGKRPPTVGPLLCTSILLKVDVQRSPLQKALSAPTTPLLDLGQKIPVVAGYLIAKNDEKPLQLLSYHRQRFGPLTLKEAEYREHFGPDASQGNVVRVSIM